MPSSNGVYSLPPVYQAVPGTTIMSNQHNSPLEDLAVEANATLRRDGTRPMQANLPMGGNKITGLGMATDAGDAVTFGQAQSAIAPGVISMYGGTVAPPGSLLCNGASYNKNAYPGLFAVIGYVYGGAGDNFNVPNMQGRVPVGAGTGYGLGSTGGAATVALTEAQMPAHSHSGTTSSVGDHTHNNGLGSGGFLSGNTSIGGTGLSTSGTSYAQSAINNTTGGAGAHNHSFTTDTRGNGQAHENMQPYVVINYIIKT